MRVSLRNSIGVGILACGLVVTGSAVADDSFEYHGYFRAGAAAKLDGGFEDGGSCFALAHPSNDGLYYRLGNECRDYGEFALVKKGSVNGLDYKGTIMIDIAGNNESSTSTQEWSRRSRQMFLEFDNVFDNGSTLWVGRRYYRAVAVGDVHIIDAFHVNSSGNGFGLTNIPFGKDNKFHFAAVHSGESDVNTIMLDGRADFNIGAAGRLKLALQHLVPLEADGAEDATGGSTLTVQWDKKIGIFDQKTVFQRGTDAMGNNPGCWGSDGAGAGNCFDVLPESDGIDGTRIFNNGTWNFSDRFKVNTMVMFEDIENVRDVTSVGIRPHYSLSKYWSLLGEIGLNEVEPAGKPAEELKKVTLALQLSADSTNFWFRPAVRFYVSKFDWNDAARDGDSGLRLPGTDQTDATIVGVQGEFWF